MSSSDGFEKLMNIYRGYIYANEIQDYYRYINEDCNKILKANINKYKKFLDNIKVNNTTYLYFKGLYYLCIGEDENMLSLLEGVNDSDCITLIGEYYFNKKTYIYKPKPRFVCKAYLDKASNMGNGWASCLLGSYYYHLKHDYKNMKKYYRKAIKLGFLQAHIYISIYYYRQRKKTMPKFYKNCKIVADQNHAYGLYLVGYFYSNGDIVKHKYGNDNLALYYYSQVINKITPFDKQAIREYSIDNINKIIKDNNFSFSCGQVIYYNRVLNIIMCSKKKKLFLPDEIYELIYGILCGL